MKLFFLLAIHLVVTLAKLLGPGGVRSVVAESLALKHQLVVANRGRRRAPNLTMWDRLLLSLTSLFIKRARLGKLAVVVSPATLFKLHDALVCRKYRRLFSSSKRGKPGRKGPSQELVDAIVELKKRNPRFGCPRIAQQISKTFGVEIDKDVVRRVLAKHYRPSGGGKGTSWLTVIGHAKDSLWSLDLFCCESILLSTHWVMVVMDQYSRRVVGFAVHAGAVDGTAVCHMFNRAVAGVAKAKRVSTDNDPLFSCHRWQANLRVLEIDEIKSVPYVPISHPFVERLIGTVRREYLDHVFFFGVEDLERKLDDFQSYYNTHRVHASLDCGTPAQKAGTPSPKVARLDDYRWQSHCRDLFQLPVAA